MSPLWSSTPTVRSSTQRDLYSYCINRFVRLKTRPPSPVHRNFNPRRWSLPVQRWNPHGMGVGVRVGTNNESWSRACVAPFRWGRDRSSLPFDSLHPPGVAEGYHSHTHPLSHCSSPLIIAPTLPTPCVMLPCVCRAVCVCVNKCACARVCARACVCV